MSYYKLRSIVFGVCIFCFGSGAPLRAASDDLPDVKSVKGPAKVTLGTVAQIEVPVGYTFLDGKATRALMKRFGEPTSGRELGLLSPTNESWSVIFEFNNIGYVKDDEKDKLDPDKILDSIKRGTAAANKERESAGNAPLIVVGWEIPPRYDSNSHNLEWAIRATSDDHPILNYNTRLLGRKGVMEAVLIVDPDKLQDTLPKFQQVLANYHFQTGQNYAEYRSGDKVAKYGLAALVVGGAAVGAAKLGLLTWLVVFFKKFAKLVIVAFVAVIASIKKFFGKITGRGSSPSASPPPAAGTGA
jgi:uncharacterized membrane-anchored protein